MTDNPFGFHHNERVGMFIDGANLYATTKSLGFDIDYKRLLKVAQSSCRMTAPKYYTAMIQDQEYSSIRPLIDWLDYNGYRVVTKPVKEFTDSAGRRKIKGNMDIELAIDALELAPHIDHMVLISGDGDFCSLVQAMQRRGVRVTVISTIQTQPAMIADDLRRQADTFIDISHIARHICRDPNDRPPPRPRHGEHEGDSRDGLHNFLGTGPSAEESEEAPGAQGRAEDEHGIDQGATVSRMPRSPSGSGRGARTLAGLPEHMRRRV